jgi:SAM-dependent methyltransferase
MTEAELADQLERIFRDVQGYQLSHSDRRRLGIEDRSFVYGEISERPFLEALAKARPQPGEVFYDLGSGTGRAVLAAAASYSFSRAVGIEWLASLVRASKLAAERLTSSGLARSPIEFLEADLREADFSDGDVVFLHSTCFQPSLLEPLARACAKLKSGARVISFGHPPQHAALELVETLTVQTGWGESAGAIFVRV